MNKLKLGLIYLQSKSELEKNLLKILCAPTQEVPRNENIRPILTELREVICSRNKTEKQLIFIKKLESLKTWEEVSKLLLIAHKAINEGALEFLNEFTLHSFKNILDLTNNAKDTRALIRCSLVEHYYKYIRTYSENYFAVTSAMHASAKIEEEEFAKSMRHIKNFQVLKQLLNIALKTEDKLTASIELFEIPIVKEMGKMVLLDAIKMYSALREFVTATIPHVFEQEEDVCLLLDDLYSDLIKLTRKLNSLYEMKGNFNDFDSIKAPKLYQFDKDFNKKEELFVYNIKKTRKAQSSHHSESLPNINIIKNSGSMSQIEPTKAMSMANNFEGTMINKSAKDTKFKIIGSLDHLEDDDYEEEEEDQIKAPSNKNKYINLLQNPDDLLELDHVNLN